MAGMIYRKDVLAWKERVKMDDKSGDGEEDEKED